MSELLKREKMARALFEVGAPPHQFWDDVGLDKREIYLCMADAALSQGSSDHAPQTQRQAIALSDDLDTFVEFSEKAINEFGWTGSIQCGRIADYFGPKNFRALMALINAAAAPPAPTASQPDVDISEALAETAVTMFTNALAGNVAASAEDRDEGFGAILKDEAKRLRTRADELDPPQSAATSDTPDIHALRPLDDWHEEMGDMLWWRIEKDGTAHEAPWVGTPLTLGVTVEAHTTTRIITQINQEHDPEPKIERIDVGGWIDDYYTHFSEIPRVSIPRNDRQNGEPRS